MFFKGTKELDPSFLGLSVTLEKSFLCVSFLFQQHVDAWLFDVFWAAPQPLRFQVCWTSSYGRFTERRSEPPLKLACRCGITKAFRSAADPVRTSASLWHTASSHIPARSGSPHQRYTLHSFQTPTARNLEIGFWCCMNLVRGTTDTFGVVCTQWDKSNYCSLPSWIPPNRCPDWCLQSHMVVFPNLFWCFKKKIGRTDCSIR